MESTASQRCLWHAIKSKQAKACARHRRPNLGAGTGRRMTAQRVAPVRQLVLDSHEPKAFSPPSTQTEAAMRIAMLQAKLKLQDVTPHTLRSTQLSLDVRRRRCSNTGSACACRRRRVFTRRREPSRSKCWRSTRANTNILWSTTAPIWAIRRRSAKSFGILFRYCVYRCRSRAVMRYAAALDFRLFPGHIRR
jgi:hypothetical protein